MAFNRKNWQDNVSDITAAELNRMEQGIYDNSLVVDAVTNTINPTDTETYKTAELTEGQITDVIGVSDIVIKGQTEQDGTPTPSAPVDVNVVSGSNVINTSNKNLWNFKNDTYIVAGITAVVKNGTITLNGTATDTSFIEIFLNNIVSWEEGEDYTISAFNSVSNNNLKIRTNANGVDDVALTAINKSSTIQYNLTTSRFNNKISIRIQNGTTLNNFILKPMLEQSSTATTYEPHQGKELPLDLPVENLLNISNDINTTTSGITVSLINTDTIDFNGVASNTYISTGTVNLTKPLESGKTYCFKAFGNNDSNLRFRIWGYNSNNELKFNVADGNSLTLNTDIIKYKLVLEWLTTNNKYNVQAKFQVSEAPYINTYTPYGTEPIELCDQDYFYKSGSKWYLHKEMKRIKLDGSENWSTRSSGVGQLYETTVSGFFSTTSLSLGVSNQYVSNISLTENNTFRILSGGTLAIHNDTISGLDNFKNALSLSNLIVYYPLATVTNTEITDTTLISQLEAIYNAPLYEETNITQENNDLPMILDITACKDNINGIKAFIRK